MGVGGGRTDRVAAGHGSGGGFDADEVAPHEPRRAFGVGAGFSEERGEVRAGGVRVERVDVRVDLVQVEDIRVSSSAMTSNRWEPGSFARESRAVLRAARTKSSR